MTQWMNLQWFEKFVNGTQLYITCEKSGGLHLAEPGLTAGCRLAGWLANEIWARLKILKACCRSKIQFSALFSQRTVLFQQL